MVVMLLLKITESKQSGLPVTLQASIQEMLGSTLSWTLAILNVLFHYFPQFFRANARLVP
jgi:hypothetical protein